MTQKRVKASDVIGNSYYIYTLQSSSNTPSLNSTINITCNVTDVYGQAISGKSITLYQNNTSKGAKTTDSSGNASWNSISMSSAGLQTFKVENSKIEVFVDNKSDVGHTHSQYLTEHQSLSNYVTTDDSRLSDSRTPTSHTHGNLQNNGQVGSTVQANKNVVTNSSGLITTEDKPTIPSASSTTPSADTENGSVGTGTTWARSNHTHPKSSIYAEASHTHSQYLTSHQSLDSKTVTVEKLSTATSGYLSSYAVKQNGVQVGNTIDIPKDFLVKSGSVKTVVVDNHPVSGYSAGDRYIDFVINTKDNSGTDEHMYILVSDLVQDNGIEYINGTHSDTTTFIFTGNSYVFNSVSDIKDGSMIIYRVPVTSTNDSDNLKLQITCKGASGYGTGGSTAYIMKNNAHVTANQYPINTKLLLVYQNGWNIIGQTNLDDAYAIANHTHNQYLTSHQDISGKEDISNKVTSLSSSSTDTQYPSAKLVYDQLATKTNVSDIKNNLTSTDTNKPLSANQGKELKALIDNKEDNIYRIVGTEVSSPSNSSARLHCGTLPFDNISGKIFVYVVPDISTLSASQKALIYGSYPSGGNISYNIFKSNNEYLTIGDIQTGDELLLMYEGNARVISSSSITNKEDKSNKVTSISSSSTDAQYPSAKLVYDELQNTIGTIVDMVYPVGSIYMSVNSTSPATLFGGTWVQIEDTFLLASGNTYNAGSTGGSATVTLTENQMPSHTHTQNAHHHGNNTSGWKWISVNGDDWTYTSVRKMSYSSGSYYYPYSSKNTSGIAESSETGDTTATNQNKGGGQAHENMPPYLAVYVWKRTA